MADPLETLKKSWNTLNGVPGGRKLFSFMVGRTAPYTGTIGAEVEELEPGFARVAMADRGGLRNHLKSIHAIALANLVELTGNLALAYSLPAGHRFIVTGMEIDYVKKARGRLVGECHLALPDGEWPELVVPEVEIKDAAGDVVVRGRVKSKVGRRKD